jgi:hypothetical protein
MLLLDVVADDVDVDHGSCDSLLIVAAPFSSEELELPVLQVACCFA